MLVDGDRAQAEADRAAEPVFDGVVRGPDARVVEDGLRDVDRAALGDQPRADAGSPG